MTKASPYQAPEGEIQQENGVRDRFFKKYLYTFMISGCLGMIMYFSSNLVHKEYHGLQMLVIAFFILVLQIFHSFYRSSVRSLLASSFGYTHGFLITVSVLISLQNNRFSVNLVTMLPALVIVPLLAFALTWPAKFLNRKGAL